ncbi:MAG: hypothetical protein HY909_09125 [Deltaproteobacteria bacterium]|nr:hypothetical protein [Deltaproteobacteria bacterium]
MTLTARDALARRWHLLADQARREALLAAKLAAALGAPSLQTVTLTQEEASQVDAMVFTGIAQSLVRHMVALLVEAWEPIKGPPGPVNLTIPRGVLLRLWRLSQPPGGSVLPAAGFNELYAATLERAGGCAESLREPLLLAAARAVHEQVLADALTFEYLVDDGERAFGTERTFTLTLTEGEELGDASYGIGEPGTRRTGGCVVGVLRPIDPVLRQAAEPEEQRAGAPLATSGSGPAGVR